MLTVQGREVGHNISKPDAQIEYQKVPVFWSSVGKGLRYIGTGAGFDDIYTDGNPSELKVSLSIHDETVEADQQFASYQAKNGKVTAVTTMQRDPIVAKASELLRLNLMPSLDEIKNGKVSSYFSRHRAKG